MPIGSSQLVSSSSNLSNNFNLSSIHNSGGSKDGNLGRILLRQKRSGIKASCGGAYQ